MKSSIQQPGNAVYGLLTELSRVEQTGSVPEAQRLHPCHSSVLKKESRVRRDYVGVVALSSA